MPFKLASGQGTKPQNLSFNKPENGSKLTDNINSKPTGIPPLHAASASSNDIVNGGNVSVRASGFNSHGTIQKSAPEALDLDKLALAVSFAETSNCTKGYALTHKNCVGLKRGSIVPCKTKGKSKMCVFETKEESLEAFKKVWAIGYNSKYPTLAIAEAWTGKDQSRTWLKHVTSKL